jgi:hypothetical protein
MKKKELTPAQRVMCNTLTATLICAILMSGLALIAQRESAPYPAPGSTEQTVDPE